ncbi:MAG: hypothetical protein IPL74_15080 [Bacteroidetes bacterium]|nr:hypothetical protein [Bacteroidota bacterium]
MTEPLTNFSVMVFDQHPENNSIVYLINTNVTRDKRYSDSNVTLSGFSLSNKKNTFEVKEGVKLVSDSPKLMVSQPVITTM